MGGFAPRKRFEGIIASKPGSFAFTLAEGATHVALPNNKRKTAFTLAEVLITLAIIGVVAALMLPTLFTNVNQKVYDAREQNIVQKVTQAMNQMKALGLLSQTYDSTEDFVDELTKHLKVTKVCKTNLENCWPTKTVTDASGAEFDVSSVKTSENINKKEFDSNSVGLVLADGAHIILAYNKSATPILETEATRPDGNTTNSTESIAFVMDVNGGRGHNTENSTKDIRGFHSASFAKSAKVYKCTGTEYDFGGTTVCYLGSTTYTWEEAKKACADMGMQLPNYISLEGIYKKYDAQKKDGSDVTLGGWFWMSTKDINDGAYHVYFDGGNTDYNGKDYQSYVLCSGS